MLRRRRCAAVPVLALAMAFALWGVANAAVLGLERVSVDEEGAAAEFGVDGTFPPSLSEDGRFVVFTTDSILVEDDENEVNDIYLRDRLEGTTERISVSSDDEDGFNEEGDDESFNPSISDDGRYVAFASFATTLVNDDTNDSSDVFVRDRETNTTRRVSLRTDGLEPEGGEVLDVALSGNGRFVAFVHTSDLSGPEFLGEKTGGGVYVRDLEFNQTERVSFRSTGQEAQAGVGVAINAEGRYVAFDTFDPDMVAGQEESGGLDVFVRDRQLDQTEWISFNGTGGPTTPGHSFASELSADGRYVMFSSQRPEILPGDGTLGHTHLYLRDRLNDTTERVDVNSAEELTNGAFAGEVAGLSANGRFVLFGSDGSNLAPGDTNGTFDIFLRDRQAGTTERVSLLANGEQAPFGAQGPALSADGRVAAFQSTSSLTDPDAEPGQLYAAIVGDPLFNRAPNAVAGDDRTVTTRASRARVRLDGFRSSDPDQDQLTFIWREGKRQIATGVNPVVRLKKGLHAITLEVRDPSGASDTDDLLIRVRRRRR